MILIDKLQKYCTEVVANQGFDFFFNKSKDSSIMIQADIKISNKTWLFINQLSSDYTYQVEWRCLPTKEFQHEEKEKKE